MGATIQENKEINKIGALVLAARKGDQKAYETLYNEFFERISRFVALRVSHKETAEDLTADIFVKVWESLPTSPEIISFPSWIFTVARNKIIDYYRTKKTFTDLLEVENFLEYEDHVVEAIDLDISTKDFLLVIDNLSRDQQHVMRLKFLEDLENQEIAAILDKTTGAVRVIQHRALYSLKKVLKSQKKLASK